MSIQAGDKFKCGEQNSFPRGRRAGCPRIMFFVFVFFFIAEQDHFRHRTVSGWLADAIN